VQQWTTELFCLYSAHKCTVQTQHRHPVLTNRKKQYVADIGKNLLPYWYWEKSENFRGWGRQSCSWQWQIGPRGLFRVHFNISLYKLEGTRHQYNCRPTHKRSGGYSFWNLLWPMLLQLLMDVPRTHQELQTNDDMQFSNFDEQFRR